MLSKNLNYNLPGILNRSIDKVKDKDHKDNCNNIAISRIDNW